LYYIGRIKAYGSKLEIEEIKNLQKDILSRALESEKDAEMRRTAIISLINCGGNDESIDEKEVEYLENMTPNSENDLINRSLQLVYYGDIGYIEETKTIIVFGMLADFKDNGKYPWKHVREQIIKSLKNSETHSLLERLWDLRTLRLFYHSRGWVGAEHDYKAISETSIDSDIFSALKKKKLFEEKEKLLKEIKANVPHKILR